MDRLVLPGQKGSVRNGVYHLTIQMAVGAVPILVKAALGEDVVAVDSICAANGSGQRQAVEPVHSSMSLR